MSVSLSIDKAIQVHAFFEWLGLFFGALIYRRYRNFRPQEGLQSLEVGSVVAGCILGALMGSKLVAWIEAPYAMPQTWKEAAVLLSGQSIVGGILGGWVGVEVGKKLVNVHTRTGDDFIWPLVVGISVGRVGCFFAGLHDGTYGNPTNYPWGVDFGDGVARHPTQLYEIGMILLTGWILVPIRRRLQAFPGLTFRIFTLIYLLWRILIDGIKPVPFAYPLSMSGIQWVALIASTVIAVILVRAHRLSRSKL